jgi:hypothetical protein
MTPLENKLMEIAFRNVPEGIKAIVLVQLEDKEPLDSVGYFEWQYYVDEDVGALWGELDFGEKLIAYIHAQSQVP